jgi:hypothetical protein
MADEEVREDDESEKVDSLKVKTNLKAGTDPEPAGAGAVGDTPIVISGG